MAPLVARDKYAAAEAALVSPGICDVMKIRRKGALNRINGRICPLRVAIKHAMPTWSRAWVNVPKEHINVPMESRRRRVMCTEHG